jgi:SAM-dependent methyltransferase
VAETHFDEWIAEHYRTLWPELFEPTLIDRTVDFLAELANGGAALEFGIGTGRIALPLSRRGLHLHGIELSHAMIAQLLAEPGGTRLTVSLGDFATTTVAADGGFDLVYLLRNTITNLTSQDEQVACFLNAAHHLRPGGTFLIETFVPELRRIPPGEHSHVFTATPMHVGVDEYDFANQIEVSRHWWTVEGELRTFASPHRYVWPSELDLMARIAGLHPSERWSDWDRSPFTAESRAHISTWTKAGKRRSG